MTKNRWLAGLCAALMMLSQSQSTYILGAKVTAASFCGGSFQFCNEFTSLSPGFTLNSDCTANDNPTTCCSGSGTGNCHSGSTWAISSNQLSGPTSGTVWITGRTTANAATTEYAIVQLAALGGEQGLFLRAGGTYRYAVYRSGTNTWWSIFQDGTFKQDVSTACAITWATGDYMMAQVTGTGASTSIKIWKTSTMPTAPPSTGETCTISGAGITSSQFADTGLEIGIFAPTGDSAARYDNFAGGGS